MMILNKMTMTVTMPTKMKTATHDAGHDYDKISGDNCVAAAFATMMMLAMMAALYSRCLGPTAVDLTGTVHVVERNEVSQGRRWHLTPRETLQKSSL